METLTPFFEYMRLGEVKRLVHRFVDELSKKKVSCVAIVSLQPGEGKTFLVAVLAMGAAVFLRKKVLVVDTNHQEDTGRLYLRRIFAEASDEKAVTLITSQSLTEKGEEVADFKLKELLEKYQNQYDLILFDTVAVNSTASNAIDPVIVSKTAGSAMIVMSNSSVSGGDFKMLNNQMKDWNISVLGTIFNFGKNV